MHVPEIGGRTILEALGDDLAQALGRKGVIRQAGQRKPLETDLPTVAFPPLSDGGQILAAAMEDGLDLMEMAMDPMHGVVLAHIFAEVEETLRHDPQAEFFEDFAPYGITQRFAVILAAAREHKELPFFGADAHGQDVSATEDDGARRRPDPGGSATGLAT